MGMSGRKGGAMPAARSGAKLVERHAERKGNFGGVRHEAVAALLDVFQGADGNTR